MSLLDAREISKGFGGTTLFADASVRIDPGERWALVGHNGSGKTTLLEIVAGNATPDAGEITRRRGLEVGYLPQETD